MTQPTDVVAPAIGACLSCRQLFLVTPETPNCILCGQSPAYTLPLPDVPLGTVEPAPVGPVEQTPSAVPLEEPSPAVEELPPAAGEEPPEGHVSAVPAPILALFRGITEFMEGSTSSDQSMRQLFVEAGAEGEQATTAVGRLSAVRDFVVNLWDRLEPPPAASEEPTAGCSEESS